MRKTTFVTLGWVGLTGLMAYGVFHGASAMNREFSLKRALSKTMGIDSRSTAASIPVTPSSTCGGAGQPACESSVTDPCTKGQDCVTSPEIAKPANVRSPVDALRGPASAVVVPGEKVRIAGRTLSGPKTGAGISGLTLHEPIIQRAVPCRGERAALARWQDQWCEPQRPPGPDPGELAALQASLDRMSVRLSTERRYFERQGSAVGTVGLDSAIEGDLQEAQGLLETSQRELQQGTLALAKNHLTEADTLINSLRNRR